MIKILLLGLGRWGANHLRNLHHLPVELYVAEVMADYSEHFLIRGKDVSPHAKDYLSGLLGTYRRKNMECIHGDIPDSNYQGIQQLLSDSPWSHAQLMTQVADETNGLLGGNRHSALLIDESSFVKKGDSSVGVQRQYCGRLGKKENCQKGVFACLGLGDKAAVVDFRLFLPESWAQSAERCDKAQIPEDQRQHRTKLELALEMVQSAKKSFSNAAQALECIFSWRGVLRALRFMFFGILCWRFCSPTTDNPILFYRGEIATKIVTK